MIGKTLKKIYLCDPSLNPICVLNGINAESVSHTVHLRSFHELSFDVRRFITDRQGNQIESNGYELLNIQMYLYLEDTGFFIMQQPELINDGSSEIKRITSSSIDKEFESKDFRNFRVNTGDKDSLDKMVEGNVDDRGFTKSFITLYNPQRTELSLLHIIFKKIPGWTLRSSEIDMALWGVKLSIDEDSINLFALLNSVIAPKAECVFIPNIKDRSLVAISKHNLDSYALDTNIFLSFRNLQSKVDVITAEDSVYTRITCSGAENLTFEDINYGESRIFDLSYFMREPYMNSTLVEKVQNWIQWRDDHRELFIECAKNRATLNESIYNLKYKVPSDACYFNQYSSMDEETLNENLKYYKATLTSLQISVDDNPRYDASGTYIPWQNTEDIYVNHDAYLEKLRQMGNGYGGYYTYLEILNYIIPNIEIAISNLGIPKDDRTDYNEDYKTDWELYGIKELENKKLDYENRLSVLSDFSKDWNNLTDEERSKYESELEYNSSGRTEYIKYQTYLGSETIAGSLLYKLNLLNQELELQTTDLQQIDNQRQLLIQNASIESTLHQFTESEIILINKLFIDTDYVNENILYTSIDTARTKIDKERELYEDSVEKLSELCQPQFSFNSDLESLFDDPNYEMWRKDIQLLNFIRIGIRDDYCVKVRIVGYTENPCSLSSQINLEFSNMIVSRSGRSDLTEMLQHTGGKTSKNSISADNLKIDADSELLSNIANLLINNGGFQNALGNTVGGMLGNGVIDTSSLVVDEGKIKSLIAEYGKFTEIDVNKITGDTASFNKLFSTYIDAEFISTELLKADQGTFNTLSTKIIQSSSLNTDVANIKDLLAGNAGVGDLQTIKITANNATMDEAFIKNVIAYNMSVEDLRSGNIILTGNMQILSENGRMIMNGTALQILGEDSNGNSYVGIQLGYDATENPSLIIRNTEGAVVLTPDGITQDAIADGLIINDMIQRGQISKDKLSFNIVEGNDYGGIDIANIYMGDGGTFGAEYATFKENMGTQLSGLSSKVDANAQSITNRVWSTDIQNALSEFESGTLISSINEKVSQNTQSISGFNQKVSELTTTMANDKKELQDSISTMNQDVEGFKLHVSNTYMTQTDVDSTITNRVSEFEQTTQGFLLTVENDYAKKTDISGLQEIANASKTTAEQTAERFAWLVQGEDETSFTLTERGVQLVSDSIDLTGRVTFNDLSSTAKMQIQSNIDAAVSNIDINDINIDVSDLDINVGAKNLLYNSQTLIYKDYSFGTPDPSGGSIQVPVSSIKLSATATVLGGQTKQLTVTYEPTTATQRGINWKSSNTDIAIVSNTGLVTWKSPGQVTITATSSVNPNLRSECRITCNEIAISSISIPSNLPIECGSASPLLVTFTPNDTTEREITWEVENPSIAEVNNGIVKWIATGTTTVIARSKKYPDTIFARCSVVCKSANVDENNSLTALSLPGTATCPLGGEVNLAVKYEPATTDETGVTWTSSNTAIATVDNNGKVTWISHGDVTITVTSMIKPEIKSSCIVTCVEKNIPITGLSIGTSLVNIEPKTTVTLSVNYAPSDTTQKNIKWTSSNNSIATVDNNGNVTWKYAGRAVITATSAYNESYTSQCTVVCKDIEITRIIVPQTAVCEARSQVQMSYSVEPFDTTQPEIEWRSENTSIATVDSATGVVTWVKEGSVKIYARSKKKTSVESYCQLECQELFIPIQNIVLNNNSTDTITCKGGKIVDIPYSFVPIDTTQRGLIWESSNTNVATVDNNGRVTWKSVGNTTITVTSSADSNITKQCNVYCEDIFITRLTMQSSAICPYNSQVQLQYGFEPSNTTQKNIEFISDNTNIATVSKTGLVTWKGVGSVNITLRSLDNPSLSQTCVVICRDSVIPIESIQLSATSATLAAQSTLTLTATYQPSDSTETAIAWRTSNPDIATVENGIVTWVSEGNVTITAYSPVRESVFTDCSVKCSALVIPIKGLTIPGDGTINLQPDSYYTIPITYIPSNTTERNVIWESSDSTIAEVRNGTVYWVSHGTVTIKVKSLNKQAIFAECTVICEKRPVPLTSLSLSESTITISAGGTYNLSNNLSYNPTDTTERTVRWSIDNPTIASIDENTGVITWVSANTTTATVTSVENPNISVSCTVICSAQVIEIAGLSLDINKTITLNKGETFELLSHLSYEPNNTSQTEVTWETGSQSIARISSTGVITAVDRGQTTITVRSVDNPNITTSCTINVLIPCQSITLSESNLTFTSRTTHTLIATCVPSNTTDSISWTSSNTNTAIVSNGLITVIANGETTIKATCGSCSAICTVVVNIQEAQYTFLDSVNMIGTTGIETGIQIGTALNSEFEFAFALNSTSYGNLLMSSSSASSNTYGYRIRQEMSNIFVSYSWLNEKITTLSSYGEKIIISLKQQRYTMGDSSVWCPTSATATTYPLRICNMPMKFSYLKVWNDGELVLDIVPAKKSDGTLGIYDNLTSTFTECSNMSE